MRLVLWSLAAFTAAAIILWSCSSHPAVRGPRAAPTAVVESEPIVDQLDLELDLWDALDRTDTIFTPMDSGSFGARPKIEPLPERRLYPIAGRVVDASGEGIGCVTVRLAAEQAPDRWREYDPKLKEISTAPGGSFQFPKVPEGVYAVQAVIETWERNTEFTRSLVSAGTTDVSITIPERPFPLPLTIRVRALLPDGSLLPKGTMRIFGLRAHIEGTIEDGIGEMTYTKMRPPPGITRVELLVSPDGDLVGEMYQVIDLGEEENVVRLAYTQTLTGTVMLEGKPCSVTLCANGAYGTRCTQIARAHV